MSEKFSGQVVLVAGGTGALGRAVSMAFLEEGATVTVTYQRAEEFDALRRAAAGKATHLEGHNVDVMSEPSVLQMVEAIASRHGKLNCMVNAVGGYAAGKKLWEAETRTLDQMLALNLRSGYVLARAAVPAILKQGRGAIVNVASMAAIDHAAASAEYCSSKAAAVAMVDCLAADLKGTGVRANSILPSIIDTEVNRRAMPTADFSKWPKPEDIARVILFLCSEDSKLINGASIPV
jgi:NAD(P)-dependent dehydrogenase (short-subunit alcohol dehydrogenase family)